MTPEIDTTRIDFMEIEQRARQLRAETMAYGMKTAREWVSAKVAHLLHRETGQTA